MLGEHPITPVLLATDLAAAKEFYHGKLGLQIDRDDGHAIVFRCGSSTHLDVTKSTTGTADQQTQAAWQVSDIRAEVAELRARGVKVEDYTSSSRGLGPAASWAPWRRRAGRSKQRRPPGLPIPGATAGRARREPGGVPSAEGVRDAAVVMAGASAVRRAGGWRSSSRARSGGAGTTEAGAAHGRSRRPALRRGAAAVRWCGGGSWQVRSVRAVPAVAAGDPRLAGWRAAASPAAAGGAGLPPGSGGRRYRAGNSCSLVRDGKLNPAVRCAM